MTCFLQKLDPEAVLHGSRACGFTDPSSDVDLLSSKPLRVLVAAMRETSLGFDLIEHITTARVPRLLLKHRPSGVVLDVVEARHDPLALKKDAYLRSWLGISAEVTAFAHKVRAWSRRRTRELPPEEGYPNSFLLLLSGFWYLKAEAHHTKGPTQQDIEPESLLQPLSSKDDGEGQRLFLGWLDFLAQAVQKPPGCMDLRSDLMDRGSGWTLIEPISGRAACSLTSFQVEQLACIAAADAALETRESVAETHEAEVVVGWPVD